MIKILENGYRVTSIVGAILIALNVSLNVLGYSLFLASSLIGAWLAYKTKAPRSFIEINLVFALINIIGLVRYA